MKRQKLMMAAVMAATLVGTQGAQAGMAYNGSRLANCKSGGVNSYELTSLAAQDGEVTDGADELNSKKTEIATLQSQAQIIVDKMADGDAKNALSKAIETSNTGLETATTAEGLTAVYNTLYKAAKEAFHTVSATGTGIEGLENFVVDAFDFDDGSTEGWGVTGCPQPTPEHGVMNFRNSNFDFWRYYNGTMPEGWYKVEVQAFFRANSDNSTSYNNYNEKICTTDAVFFGDNGDAAGRYSVPVRWVYSEDCSDVDMQTGDTESEGTDNGRPNNSYQANKCFESGKYKITVHAYVNPAAKGNKLTIGFKGTNQGGSWLCFDNIRLTYMGTDRTVMWDAMVENGATVAETVSEPYAQNFKANEIKAKPVSPSTEDIWNLNSRIKGITNLVKEVSDAAGQIDEIWNNSTAAEAIRAEYDVIRKNAHTARKISVTSSDDLTAIINRLKEDSRDYMKVADPVGDYTFDMNYLLTNPSTYGMPAGSIEGWYCDVNCDKFENVWEYGGPHNGKMDPQVWESVQVSNSSALVPNENGSGWMQHQRTALPKGAYHLEAATYGVEKDAASAYLSVGQGVKVWKKGGTVDTDGLTWDTLDFTLAEDATEDNPIKLGLWVDENNQATMFGIQYMKLIKVAPESLEFSETEEHNVTSDTYANVTLTRNLKGGKWNTFCVPFDMEKGEIFTAVKKLTGAVTSGETTTLTFEDAESIEAGVPYIVKVGESDVQELAVNGVTVKAAAPGETAVKVTDESGNTITMIGNYTTKTIKDGEFFISNDAFYVADKDVTVKGYRAYITVEAAASGENNVNRMLIDIDGEVTAIEEVLGDEVTGADKPVDVYTLSGVRVKSGVKAGEALEGLAKGIYIVNGKKVIK